MRAHRGRGRATHPQAGSAQSGAGCAFRSLALHHRDSMYRGGRSPHRRGAFSVHENRPLRRGRCALCRVPARLSRRAALRGVRAHARRAADARAHRLAHRRSHAGSGAQEGLAGAAGAGRHPRRRNRRQGRGLPRPARSAGEPRRERRAGPAGAGVRPSLQRRRPRTIRALEPAQPARTRGDGMAHDFAKPQPESRLLEGGCARDAGDAAARERLGPARVHRPARHRRRAVRARHRGADRAGGCRRRGAPARRPLDA